MRIVRLGCGMLLVAGLGLAQIQLSQPIGSIFDGGLASSLLAADTAPISISSVKSGSDFGGFSEFASGSWIEIKGTGLAGNTRIWADGDFTGATAPTSLDGVRVTVGTKDAFVYYISPTQINVQVPDDPGLLSGPVEVKVLTGGGSSAPMIGQKRNRMPGMLASSAFNVGGKQYLVGILPDGVYVGRTDLIQNVAFRPAKPGDTVVAYGIGFGEVKNTAGAVIPSGKIVTEANTLSTPVTVAFGSTNASIAYQGLAPNFIGLYQFNFVVPNVADGDYQINISQGGVPLTQGAMYLTVKK